MLFERCELCGGAARGLCSVCRCLLPAAVAPDLQPLVDHVYAAFGYELLGVDLLRRIKFGNRRGSLGPLGHALAASLAADLGDLEAVVSVPANPGRARKRGYDLPAVLASVIARALEVPVDSPLRRTDRGAQRGRTRSERLAALGYEAIAPCAGSIVLVDDVVTTGTTLMSCATALRTSGAAVVVGAVLAATPPSNTGVGPLAADTVSV